MRKMRQGNEKEEKKEERSGNTEKSTKFDEARGRKVLRENVGNIELGRDRSQMNDMSSNGVLDVVL